VRAQDNDLSAPKAPQMDTFAHEIRKKEPEHLAIFPAHRAGALAGVSGNRIGQWARYGLITATLYEGRPRNLYAFFDVAEAIAVHWLLDRGFTYENIHDAIDHARRSYPNWPLLTAPLGVAQHAVDGDRRGAIVEEVERGVYVDVGRGNQVTLKPQLLERVRDMLRRGGWIAEELHLHRIEVDPDKLGGMPTLKGRRWPIERVAQLAADAEGRRVLIEDYGLDERDVEESTRWVQAAARLSGRARS
jgi:uncharacterized protein (DUF433 family)/DNA-binding transcriptional MerR regulator